MNKALRTVIRGTLLMGGAICVVAVLMGQMVGSSVRGRRAEPVRLVNFPVAGRPLLGRDVAFVNVDTGVQAQMDIPPGDWLDLASVSPWIDGSGQGQVAGRWASRSGPANNQVISDLGLARFAFPHGRPLNRISTEITPTGPLCWVPAMRAEVLFAAGDGNLYRFAFEESHQADASSGGCDSRPQAVVWKTTPPGGGEGHVTLSDPIWPTDRRFGNRIIVSMTIRGPNENPQHPSGARLWWLELDEEGSTILDAGPLTHHADGDTRRERRPAVVRAESGEMRVAYLSRPTPGDPWSIVVNTIAFAPGDDDKILPIAEADSAVTLMDTSEFTSLAFSLDGHWLYHSSGKANGLVHRVAVPSKSQPLPASGRVLATLH